jgi:hypothetical protein
LPLETDTPLIVNPDAVLALPVANQGLKLVARWNEQILQCFGTMQEIQLAPGYPLNRSETLCKAVIKKRLGIFIAEGFYHIKDPILFHL